MTKLTEYTFSAKQEAMIEAQRSNAEVQVLQKQMLVHCSPNRTPQPFPPSRQSIQSLQETS
tara:strand:- start:411 stop:593 length:183 start_codon:yes stop_codon:yes gene_type:complete